MYLYASTTNEPLSKELVGGKGYYVHEMTQAGLPVPPAMFLTTELWQAWHQDPAKVTNLLRTKLIPQIIAHLSAQNGGKFPLVSVRSAGAVSMPGMMDTILNVGNPAQFLPAYSSLKITSPRAHSPRASSSGPSSSLKSTQAFYLDCCVRFLIMYGTTVAGIPKDALPTSASLAGSSWPAIQTAFAKVYTQHHAQMPSDDPAEQLLACITAVFQSWNNDRAKLYRSMHSLDESAGTAVVIQQMVFGNRNDNSATGVLFSRNPNNGTRELAGEYLPAAQGEDVVSGSATPLNISHLATTMPEVYAELEEYASALESKYHAIQDIEFTVDDGKLYILQARTAKTTSYVKLKTLFEMEEFGELTPADVLAQITLPDYLHLNLKEVDPSFTEAPLAHGLPASLGVVSGRVVFGPSTKYQGDPIVFLAKETTPDDLKAIQMSDGVLTSTGGATSHAAVVTRGLGKVCITGCAALTITTDKSGTTVAKIGSETIHSGDWLTLDANTGNLWLGRDVPVLDGDHHKFQRTLEDLVFKAHPEWTRLTSKVDDLLKGEPMFFLTYNLESADHAFMKKELTDACEFLTGVMDLTGKFDFLQQQYPGQILLASHAAREAFLAKKNLLLDLHDYPGTTFDFQVYLGPYEAEFADEFTQAGIQVYPASQLAIQPSSPPSAIQPSPAPAKSSSSKSRSRSHSKPGPKSPAMVSPADPDSSSPPTASTPDAPPSRLHSLDRVDLLLARTMPAQIPPHRRLAISGANALSVILRPH